jgi:hypothetical protein
MQQTQGIKTPFPPVTVGGIKQSVQQILSAQRCYGLQTPNIYICMAFACRPAFAMTDGRISRFLFYKKRGMELTIVEPERYYRQIPDLSKEGSPCLNMGTCYCQPVFVSFNWRFPETTSNKANAFINRSVFRTVYSSSSKNYFRMFFLLTKISYYSKQSVTNPKKFATNLEKITIIGSKQGFLKLKKHKTSAMYSKL